MSWSNLLITLFVAGSSMSAKAMIYVLVSICKGRICVDIKMGFKGKKKFSDYVEAQQHFSVVYVLSHFAYLHVNVRKYER